MTLMNMMTVSVMMVKITILIRDYDDDKEDKTKIVVMITHADDA